MPTTFLVDIATDHLIRLTGASTVSLETGERVYLDAGATVEFRLQTPDFIDVTGETWPQPMHYIANSAGDFLGVLRDTVALVPLQTYRLVTTIDNGVDQHATRIFNIVCNSRR